MKQTLIGKFVVGLGFGVAALVAGLAAASPASAAVVYCKRVGVPKGCVVRPTVPPAAGVGAPGVVVAPGVGAPGVGVTPGVGAPGVGVARGVGLNAGGPVNRVGVR